MPQTYPQARFEPTRFAIDSIIALELTLNDVIAVVQQPNSSWEGLRTNQKWYQGKVADGRILRVLIEERAVTLVKIIDVRLPKGA